MENSDKYKIRYSIKEIAKSTHNMIETSHICSVYSVDVTNNTCDVEPIDGSPMILDVKLITQDDGYLIIPSVNSKVIVSMLDEDSGFVSMFSEIDYVKIKVNTEIWLNGDDYKGLVKVTELLQKLNNLENAFNSHTHPTAAVGPPSIPTPVPGQIPLTPTEQTEIENESVKHGNGN